jgi:hypothetical protein
MIKNDQHIKIKRLITHARSAKKARNPFPNIKLPEQTFRQYRKKQPIHFVNRCVQFRF